jgi:hypothetical protein
LCVECGILDLFTTIDWEEVEGKGNCTYENQQRKARVTSDEHLGTHVTKNVLSFFSKE